MTLRGLLGDTGGQRKVLLSEEKVKSPSSNTSLKPVLAIFEAKISDRRGTDSIE